jgi:AAA family ATP:ADP antiporter
MRGLLQKLFDIREGEGLKASLMFAYIFLIIGSLMIVKPVRNSLFLVKFGVEKLPYVFVLVALFSALAAWLSSKLFPRINLNRLILNTIVVSIVCFLFFWILLHVGYHGSWLLYAFYIWVTIFGALTSAQFWLLANYVFNAREAKRLFGFVGAGGISGAIFGGYLTNYLAPRLRTENLIFLCIGFLSVCIVLFWPIWQKSARQSYQERTQSRRMARYTQTTDNPIKLILNSRHLSYIAGIIGVSVVVASLVDYQFSAVASKVITDTDRLTAFFGFWLSNLSVFSLAVQLILTSRIMKNFGVATSLFFLPISILMGAVAILVSPALWSAILIKVTDGSFKNSINKAGVELLSLPIPSEIKNKAKTMVYVVVDHLATGLAGFLLIVLTVVLGFPVQHISLIIICLIAVWIYFILRAKEEYVNSFRLAIEKWAIDLEEQSLNLQDASVFKGFMKTLDGPNQRQILYVLHLIEDVQNKELIPYLQKFIRHPSEEIKALVLKMAHQYDELDLTSEASFLTKADDETLRNEAVRYLCERSAEPLEALRNYLNQADHRVRSAALIYAARKWKESKQFRSTINLKKLIDDMLKNLETPGYEESQKRNIKTNVAKIIGITGDPKLCPYLNILLNDHSLEVVRTAVVSAGQIQSRECAPALIRYLGTKEVRKYARGALAEYGERIIDTLAQHLENPKEGPKIRQSIPRVLALIGSQKSVDVLLNNINQRELVLRYQVMKALNKLRVRFPALKSNKALIEARILVETRHYYRTLTILYRQRDLQSDRSIQSAVGGSGGNNKARQLLITALEEKLDDNLERIFRLLGLRYQPQDMYNAYLGVTSQGSNLRAEAVEFLDNVLKADLKKIIIPIVETTPTEVFVRNIQELFGFGLPTEEKCIHFLLEGADNWLKVCALYFIAERNYHRYLDSLSRLTHDPDPLVNETSKYCLDRMGIST